MSDWLTANGLLIPTIEDMLAKLSADQKANLESTLDTEPDAPMGQLNGIVVATIREVWEGVSIAHNGLNPDAAEDFLLDVVCAITGTKRGAATFSTTKLSLNLDANKTVLAGSLVSRVDDPTILFALDQDVVSTTAGVYENNPATCTTLGRTVANAGTLTVIQTPVVGWNSVTNPRDAVLGHERDTDPELRVRRLEELGGAGSGTVQAVRSAVLQIQLDDESKPVIDCIVTENVSDYPDINDVPGHAIEAIIWDGQTADAPDDGVAQAIFDNKASGITAYGNDVGTAVDEQGKSHSVGFTRVALLDIKITISVVISSQDPSTFAGTAAVKTALITEHEPMSALGLTELRNQRYRKAVMLVPGVLDITNLQIGKVGDPFLANGANFPIPVRTKILLDTSDITVTTSLDVP